MLHRINKAHPAVWVDPNTLQIGLGDQAIRLTEVTGAQQQLIAALYSGIVDGQKSVLEEATGASSGTANELIDRLGNLVNTGEMETYSSWNELGFTEIARAALDYQVNGEMVLAERWQRKIHIDQLDKTGLMLSKALLASGVGEILTHDTGKVLQTDLGELGYPKSQYNTSRFNSASSILQELQLVNLNKPRLRNLQSKPFRDEKISFALLVGHLALAPRNYSRWMARDVQHLAINYLIDSVEVSPVIIPGVTACLNCYQENLVDEDEAWPVIASQLLDLPRVRDDAAALLTATGLAVRSILRSIDELAGFEYKADSDRQYSLGYRVEYSTGSVTRMKFDKHNLCSCIEFSQTAKDSD